MPILILPWGPGSHPHPALGTRSPSLSRPWGPAPHSCPPPGDPVPTPAPEDPVPIPWGLQPLPCPGPGDPSLIPVLPWGPCAPMVPHPLPMSPVPQRPIPGGWRLPWESCQGLLSPAPCAGMGQRPELALPEGPKGFGVPRTGMGGPLGGQGRILAKPSHVQQCPGKRVSSWGRFLRLCPHHHWGHPASQPGTCPRSLGLEVKCPLSLPLLPVPSVPPADGMRCPLGDFCPFLRRSCGRASGGVSPCCPTALDFPLHQRRAVTRDPPGRGKHPGPGRRQSPQHRDTAGTSLA